MADASPTPADGAGPGLRERKKQHMRKLLSDTATAMFLQRGFDEVRVAEIAEACGVSEKTVYNYFPSKEDLLLDEEADLADAIRGAAFTPETSPVQAMLGVLEGKLQGLTEAFTARGGAPAMSVVGRFADLVESTPSLRAHHRDSVDRLVTVAAGTLADRTGRSADEPELQIVAFTLIALWRILIHSLQRHADGVRTPDRVADLVLADLHRAADLVDAGLPQFWRE
jgi:AcrR family transcriptional regulator